MVTFLYICILVIPWIMIPNSAFADPYRVPKETFFDIICMGIIVWSFFRGITFNYRNKFLSVLIGWVFFTIVLNWYIPFTITLNNRQIINLGTIGPSLHFIFAIWASFIALSYLTKEHFVKIAQALCISSVLVTLFGLMQILNFDPYGKLVYYNHQNHFGALLDNPNLVGNYLCLIAPLFLMFKQFRYKIGFIFVVLGIILTKSDLSIATFLGAMWLYLLIIKRKEKLIVISLFIVLILGLWYLFFNIFPKEIANEFSNRTAIWQQTLVHIKDNPLFGQGLGIFKTWEIRHMGTLSLEAHSDWLERICDIGFLGVILIAGVIVNSLKNFNYKLENNVGICYLISFVSFLVLMIGSFPMEIAPVALTGLISFWAIEKL